MSGKCHHVREEVAFSLLWLGPRERAGGSRQFSSVSQVKVNLPKRCFLASFQDNPRSQKVQKLSLKKIQKEGASKAVSKGLNTAFSCPLAEVPGMTLQAKIIEYYDSGSGNEDDSEEVVEHALGIETKKMKIHLENYPDLPSHEHFGIYLSLHKKNGIQATFKPLAFSSTSSDDLAKEKKKERDESAMLSPFPPSNQGIKEHVEEEIPQGIAKDAPDLSNPQTLSKRNKRCLIS